MNLRYLLSDYLSEEEKGKLVICLAQKCRGAAWPNGARDALGIF